MNSEHAISFLQSPEWQEIQERAGRPCVRIAGVLVIRHDLPFGFRYLYCPRPAGLAPIFFEEASRFADESGAMFMKIDPAEQLEIEYCLSAGALLARCSLGEAGAERVKIVPSNSLQPQSTIRIDCRESDAALLSAMHPKTRYNIRLAERKGVTVRRAECHELEPFFGLLGQTSRRDGFAAHPAAHYRSLLEVRSDECANELWFAERAGVLLAAAVVNRFRPTGTVTYLHGASHFQHRAFMAPHLLHFRLMQEARRSGFRTYDFGGIDERCWPGVTRFKKGFGGMIIHSPPAGDIVFRPLSYRFWRIQHRLRHSGRSTDA